MASEILMPKMGMTMESGTVIEWLVDEGAKVEKGDILLSVETDKAALEVESFSSGILLKILVGDGETVPVLQPIGIIGEMGEDISQIGSVEEDGKVDDNRVPAENIAVSAENEVTEIFDEKCADIKATPAAKKLAKEKGTLLSDVASGANGVISEQDVVMFLAGETKGLRKKITPTAKKLAETLCIDTEDIDSNGRIYKRDILNAAVESDLYNKEYIELKGIRKIAAETVMQTWTTMPMVTNSIEVEVSELLALVERLNGTHSQTDIRVNITDVLLKILGYALKKNPNGNVRFQDGKLKLLNSVDVGLAVATDNGLTVPVIRNVIDKNIFEISEEKAEVIKLAKEGKITPDRFGGAGTTLTNVGSFRAQVFTPIINYPESCIVGTGMIQKKAIVVDDEIVIRPMMWLNCTYDHRVFDGAQAADFVNLIRDVIEMPGLIIS